MEEKRDQSKTLAERVYNANILPDGNLNSVGLFDVVLYNLENVANSDLQSASSPSEEDGNKKEEKEEI